MRLLFSALVAVAFVASLQARPLRAQARLTADTDVRAAPDGNAVARLRSGTSWTAGPTRDGFTQVTITGWVEGSRFATGRDSFPQTIGGTGILRIREEPSLDGRILGEFLPGAGVQIIERRGSWARIRRIVWAPANALTAPPRPAPTPTTAPAVAPANPPAPTAPTPPAAEPAREDPSTLRPPVRAGALRPDSSAAIYAGPGGEVIGTLGSEAIAMPISRDRGWVKVRIEGWVAESLLVPADTTFGATISAADLRLDPLGMRGRVVRWSVQIIGLRTADPLRRDMAINEPFLLAVGPHGEDAILYIAVPPALLNQARALAPLSRVILTARIRTGRSDPTGAPILELISIVGR